MAGSFINDASPCYRMGTDEYQSRDTAQKDDEELISEIGENIRTYKNQQASRFMDDGRSDADASKEALETLRADITEYADRVLDEADWERFQDETGIEDYSAKNLARDITHSIKNNEYEKAGEQVEKLEELAGTSELSETVGRYLR